MTSNAGVSPQTLGLTKNNPLDNANPLSPLSPKKNIGPTFLQILSDAAQTTGSHFALLWIQGRSSQENLAQVHGSELFKSKLNNWFRDELVQEAMKVVSDNQTIAMDRDGRGNQRPGGLGATTDSMFIDEDHTPPKTINTASDNTIEEEIDELMSDSDSEPNNSVPPTSSSKDTLIPEESNSLLPQANSASTDPDAVRTISSNHLTRSLSLGQPTRNHSIPLSRSTGSIRPSNAPLQRRRSRGTLDHQTLTLAPPMLTLWYLDKLTSLQPKHLAIICNAWIGLIDPHYSESKGQPEWWPGDTVRHCDPNHLMQSEREALCMNLLRYCGIRIDRFESATAAFLPLWSSVKRMALEDLYRVARAEELAIELNGGQPISALKFTSMEPTRAWIDPPKGRVSAKRRRKSTATASPSHYSRQPDPVSNYLTRSLSASAAKKEPVAQLLVRSLSMTLDQEVKPRSEKGNTEGLQNPSAREPSQTPELDVVNHNLSESLTSARPQPYLPSALKRSQGPVTALQPSPLLQPPAPGESRTLVCSKPNRLGSLFTPSQLAFGPSISQRLKSSHTTDRLFRPSARAMAEIEPTFASPATLRLSGRSISLPSSRIGGIRARTASEIEAIDQDGASRIYRAVEVDSGQITKPPLPHETFNIRPGQHYNQYPATPLEILSPRPSPMLPLPTHIDLLEQQSLQILADERRVPPDVNRRESSLASQAQLQHYLKEQGQLTLSPLREEEFSSSLGPLGSMYCDNDDYSSDLSNEGLSFTTNFNDDYNSLPSQDYDGYSRHPRGSFEEGMFGITT